MCIIAVIVRNVIYKYQKMMDIKIFLTRSLLFAVLLLLPAQSWGQSRSAVDTSTDILMFAPGAAGACVSLLKGDYKGLLQLAESGVTAVAASYLLKHIVKKERPDGSDNKSFPSNHATAAFAGAAFLQRRYGWKYAVPAYAVSTYVAWGRVYAKKHDFWDVLAGAAIGAGCAYIYTRPFATEHKVVVAPAFTPDGGPGVYFSMSF